MTCTRCYHDADLTLPIYDVYGEHEADLCVPCIEDIADIVESIRSEEEEVED